MTDIVDVFNDPYGRKKYASIKRKEFERLKRTPEFRKWRKRQLQIQKYRCAYCKMLLGKSIVVHIDHVQPLYCEGKNDFSNLVLACRRCNLRKWISDRYIVPEWVRRSEEQLRINDYLRPIRERQRRQMKDAVNEELDGQLLDDELG
jgi:hypothetical protein